MTQIITLPRTTLEPDLSSLNAYKDTAVTILHKFKNINSELFLLLISIKKLTMLGSNVDLYLPYFPYSRSGDIFLEIVNLFKDSGVQKITSIDLHDDVDDDVIENIEICDLIEESFNETDLVVFPDAGAARRYRNLFPHLPKAHGTKTRFENGLAIEFSRAINGDYKNVLIVDDIISSGQTLEKTFDLLYDAGLRDVKAFVTHNLLTNPNFKYASNIVTTNSTDIQNCLTNKIDIIKAIEAKKT